MKSKKTERRIWSIEIVESMVAFKIDKDASNEVSEITDNNGEDDSAIDFRYYDDSSKFSSHFLSLARKLKILKNIPFMYSLYGSFINFILGVKKFKAKKFFVCLPSPSPPSSTSTYISCSLLVPYMLYLSHFSIRCI